jgi:hypothetical protein
MTFKNLVEKCFRDRSFYQRLKEDPEAALQNQPIKNETKRAELIKALDEFKSNYKKIDDIVALMDGRFT